MSAPSPPPDNSLAVEQSRQQAAKDAQVAQDKKDQDKKDQLATLRTGAQTTARGSAQDYFTQHGLDPSNYNNAIDSKINQVLSGISPDDPNPGSYFQNIGENVYSGEETGARNKALNSLNSVFPANFDTSRVPMSLDDSYLSGVQGEQYNNANRIIDNMLSRGVITPSGKASAVADLDRQTPTVMSRLTDVGNNILSGEQQNLRDIANKGRQTAQTLSLGTNFDPSTYSSEADQSFNDFLGNLNNKVRASAPGNLYNTSGLGAIAGIGQGAQNTAFDPAALAGVITDNQTNNRTNATPTSVF